MIIISAGLHRIMAINIFRECVLCASQFNIVLFGAAECDYILLYNHMEKCGQSQYTRWIFGIQKYTRYNQQEPSQGHKNGVRCYHYVCIVVATTLLHILYRKISWWYFVWWTRSRWLKYMHTYVCICIHNTLLWILINNDDLLSFLLSFFSTTVRDVIYFLVPIAQW